jgi:hypothetical protein
MGDKGAFGNVLSIQTELNSLGFKWFPLPAGYEDPGALTPRAVQKIALQLVN